MGAFPLQCLFQGLLWVALPMVTVSLRRALKDWGWRREFIGGEMAQYDQARHSHGGTSSRQSWCPMLCH